MLNELWFVV